MSRAVATRSSAGARGWRVVRHATRFWLMVGYYCWVHRSPWPLVLLIILLFAASLITVSHVASPFLYAIF